MIVKSTVAPPEPVRIPPAGVRGRLLASSALMLFLELALIRWTGSNVVHLAYFSNFVLMGSFLGIGLGFLMPSRRSRVPLAGFAALVALVGIIQAFPVTVDRSSEEVIYFTGVLTGPPAWLMLPIIFIAVAVVMAGAAQLVARCFPDLPRLDAYRLDLLGSLAGIGAFTALSFLHAPPVGWGLVVAVGFAALLGRSFRKTVLVLCTALVAILGIEPLLPSLYSAYTNDGLTRSTYWSPYQKISTRRSADGSKLAVDVNGIVHQAAKHIDPAAASVYGLPYARTPGNPLREVLIVGAGTGNDVSLALANGAKHIDAVEIDPQLQALGRAFHPDKPYDDPRVTRHINDGRAFLQGTDTKYDLVLFALPDSLTLVSGASSLRLESYLFTEQSLRSVRDHLTPEGAFGMYNYYRRPWLLDRFGATAQAAFGHAPCVDRLTGGEQLASLTVARDAAKQSCATSWTPDAAIGPATDDRPFPYLRNPGIPSLYLVTVGLILAVSLLAVRLVGGPLRRMRPYTDLFLLGAAFMLLETKSVTGFALLFGTTWMVNAMVFGGVLIAVLAAVETTRRFRTPPLPVLFGLLFAGLALAWLIPADWLLGLPALVRLPAAIGVAFLPIFAANVIFARRFTETADATTAFAANLLGAMVGGCLEYLALLLGYNALLLLAGGLYLAALAFVPGVLRRVVPA